MSNLTHIVYSAFNVREVPPLCEYYECNKARSRATSLGMCISVHNPWARATSSVRLQLLSKESVHLIHRLLLHRWQHMRIYIRCCAETTMSKNLLYHLHRYTHT